ncbi:snRNA transcription by RNA polymerase III [Desmophyllum pertusum]|uniref:snRNA transcription by RNA polymerase III n=1 Tax=Desmophyllum pertusum TaxID=174260 RepID=A0A9X0CZQ2_9CNID|nr:snRNA transcription by RNA polymerase III [Desmophyllum pertusum]
MSSVRMVNTTTESSSDPSCSSCAKMKEALEALKKEHTLTLRMVKEKIISTDELIKKYQQKCHESDKHLQQVTDCTLKLEAAQMKTETLQSQLDRSLHSSEPLRKNVARLHREKSLADSAISELREKLQSCEKNEFRDAKHIKNQRRTRVCLEIGETSSSTRDAETKEKKSDAAIVKLQQQLKKEKEQKKELTRSLSQANRKTAKIEQQLQKSKEEIQSIKLEAEFGQSRVLEKDLIGGTPKPRQRQKSRQPPQSPKAHKQTSSSGPHPNQQLAHIIEELTVLSDMGPALSPLPPSPDRGALEHSSGSEEESVSESSSEDDGNTSEDGDSDHSLGDLADMLIGDHSEAEQLVASPGETGVNAQDIDEDINNSFGEETKTENDADSGKTEDESSMKQTPNESKDETSKREAMILDDGIQAQVNEHSHIIESKLSDIENTEQIDKVSANTTEHSNTEKFTVVASSPPRKGKRRVTSPKPRVMTRSRAKAMKLSTSSDADSSSERETGKELLSSTRKHPSKMSDAGLKRNTNASRVQNLSVVIVGTSHCRIPKRLTLKAAQKQKREVHVERNFPSSLSDASSSDADDVTHHHGNVSELGCSAASLSGLDEQITNQDNSNVFSAEVDADVTHHHGNDDELGCSAASLSGLEDQLANQDNSNAAEVEADVTHHHTNDGELGHSASLHSDLQIANEGNTDVFSAPVMKAATNIPAKLEMHSEQECSSTCESGIRVSVPLNMACEENLDINEMSSPERSNTNYSESISTKTSNVEADIESVVTITKTVKYQISQDNIKSLSIASNALSSQLQSKENAFERGEKTLEENNNVLEDLEAIHDQLEVDSVLEVDEDSSDQIGSHVQDVKTEPSSCTTEEKSSDLSELPCN